MAFHGAFGGTTMGWVHTRVYNYCYKLLVHTWDKQVHTASILTLANTIRVCALEGLRAKAALRQQPIVSCSQLLKPMAFI